MRPVVFDLARRMHAWAAMTMMERRHGRGSDAVGCAACRVMVVVVMKMMVVMRANDMVVGGLTRSNMNVGIRTGRRSVSVILLLLLLLLHILKFHLPFAVKVPFARPVPLIPLSSLLAFRIHRAFPSLPIQLPVEPVLGRDPSRLTVPLSTHLS